jgi:endonuclease/exonuclease/phosphatase family metal-dependent hydrolase
MKKKVLFVSLLVMAIFFGCTASNLLENPNTPNAKDPQYETIRIVSACLTSGNYQNYNPGQGIRILQGVQPDIVCIQEMNYLNNSDPDIQTLADLVIYKTGSPSEHARFYRTPSVDIPTGIISKYPILSSGTWDDPSVTIREFAWAQIDIPGPKNLWCVSVNFLTNSIAARKKEADDLSVYINANVPSGDFLVIAGDFNTNTLAEDCYTSLAPVVNTIAIAPVDQNGNPFTNASRTRSYDGVFANPMLQNCQTTTIFGASSYVNGAVIDTRVFTPLSDIDPALSTDSAATNMQHMCVVKDYRIQTN